MKPRSAKNKGKRLQNAIRDLILEHFPQLEPDDVVSTLMGDSGTDIKLSPLARKVFPYSAECKNQEKLNIWSALEQAENNTKENTDPIVFFKRNNTKVYAIITAEHFFKLISDHKDTTEET
jgi:hypothetical protein